MSSVNASSPSPSLETASVPKAELATIQTQSSEQFHLESCSPRVLADALVAARGRAEAFRVLHEASKLLAGESKDATVVSPEEKRHLSAAARDGVSHDDSSNDNERLLGGSLLTEPIETSFLSPRMGKFFLQIHENGLSATKTNDPAVKFSLLKDGDGNGTVGGVSHVLLFPKPEDCKAIVYNRKIDEDSKPKKIGGNLVVLRLESPLQIPKQKSPTQQLCFALPADKKLGRPTAPSLTKGETCSEDDPTEAWGRILHRALGGKLAQVLQKNASGFKSFQAPNTSTTTAGMPYVSCYLGVNDGVLYPLEEGLLFYKPPRFLPRSNLHSIACGRGGGGGGGGDSSSRYVDMVIQCQKEGEDEIDAIEFTNIQREETSVLNSYIHDVLIPAMTRDAKKSKAMADGDDDDDDDDCDQVVVEAVADESNDDEETDDDEAEEIHEKNSEHSDSDADDEDFKVNNSESEDGDSDGDESSVDDVCYGEDDEGIAVVRDEFAHELVNEKRRKQDEESSTESEDEDSSSGKPRFSKRLRRSGI